MAVLAGRCDAFPGVVKTTTSSSSSSTSSSTTTDPVTTNVTEDEDIKNSSKTSSTPLSSKKKQSRSILSSSSNFPALWYPLLPEIAIRTASGRVLLIDLKTRVAKSIETDGAGLHTSSTSMSLVPASAYGLGGGDLLISTFPSKVSFYAPSSFRLRLSVDALQASLLIKADASFRDVKTLFAASLLTSEGSILSAAQHVVSLSSAASRVLGVLPRDGGCAVIVSASSRISTSNGSFTNSGEDARFASTHTVPAPEGVTLLPLLPSVLRACLEVPSFANSSTQSRDAFLASTLRRMISNSAPFVRAGLRAFLHDAIDDEHRASVSAHLNVTLSRRFTSSSSSNSGGVGGGGGGVLVDVLSGSSPTAASSMRALAGALRIYLPTRGISLEAVASLVEPDGAKLYLDNLAPSKASPPKVKVVDILGEGVTASDLDIQEGLALSSSTSSLRLEFPARSPRLTDALSLLRRTSAYAFLDTVSAVGRTLEEDQLPLLFPAAGDPRAIFDSCLTCAKVSAGGGRHTINSLRYLQAASATLLLANLSAMSINSSPKEDKSAKKQAKIENHEESIALAAVLVSSFGSPNPLSDALVQEMISAQSPLQPLIKSEDSQNGDLEARLRSALFLQCEPATAASVVLALLQLAEGVRAYCSKLRSSGQSSSSSTVTTSASTTTSGTVSVVESSSLTTPTSTTTLASNGGGGLWGYVMSMIGFSTNSSSSTSDGGPATSSSMENSSSSPSSPFSEARTSSTLISSSTTSGVNSSSSSSSSQQQQQQQKKKHTLLSLSDGISAARADPVVQHLLVTVVPLLAHVTSPLVPFTISPYSSSRQASLALEIAAGSAGVVATSSRPGSNASVDLKAVQLATADLAAAQAKWLHEQTKGLAACVQGVQEISSSFPTSSSASGGHTLITGDAIAKVDSFACNGASIDTVRFELGRAIDKNSASGKGTVDALRIVSCSLLRVLVAILNNNTE